MIRIGAARALVVAGALGLLMPAIAQARIALMPPPVAAVAAATTSTSAAQPALSENIKAASSPGLSRADLIALVQPAVVRIMAHFSGTTTVPNFKLNLKTLVWSVDTSTSTPVPYDQYALGSGFIVNPNGYIVTNSHVVSSAELLSSLATRLAQRVVLYEDYAYPARQTAKLNALSSADLSALIDQGVQFIEQSLSIPPPTVVVLKPGTPLPATSTPISVLQEQQSLQGQGAQLSALMRTGVTAQIASVDDNYLNDEKDVALLKVPETGLPAAHLAPPGSAHEGDRIYVVSFPGSADLNSYSDHPSFTSGTVNAFKDSTQHTFAYLQTDADVSSGSSGSPMLDVNGQVVGVTTLSVTGTNGGTAFAFGIPIALVSQMLTVNGVPAPDGTDYASYLRKGLALEQARHCVAAKKDFAAAEKANPIFGNVAALVSPYIDACNALIASDKSIDTWPDYVSNWFQSQSVQFWVLFVLATALILGLAVGVFALMRHLRKDEALLRELQKKEAQDEVVLGELRSRAEESESPALAAPAAIPAGELEGAISPDESPRPRRAVNLLAPDQADEPFPPA